MSELFLYQSGFNEAIEFGICDEFTGVRAFPLSERFQPYFVSGFAAINHVCPSFSFIRAVSTAPAKSVSFQRTYPLKNERGLDFEQSFVFQNSGHNEFARDLNGFQLARGYRPL